MKPTIPTLLFAAAATVASAQTFDTNPTWMKPEGLNGQWGYSVASCGDMNGDGYDDVILGGPFWNSGASQQAGAVLIYLGSESGLTENHRWFWIGLGVFSTLGSEVAFAGDVNNDGYDDVAFNFGSGMGDGTHGMYVQLGDPVGHGAWEFDTGLTYAALGPSIDGAGDVNGDGYDDIVSGFPLSDGGRGRLRAFHGSPTGLPLVPDWQDVGDVDQQLGRAIRFAGDVDGDGYDDVLVCDDGIEFALYRGSPFGLGPSPVWSYPQIDSACALGQISAAGDLNDDGYDDVLVGVFNFVWPGPDERGFQVFLGSADGLAAEPAQTILGAGAFAVSMASVRDVNGDGCDDVVVGAHDEPGGGRVYLYLGSEIGLQPWPAWANGPVPDSHTTGKAVSSAGDVNGDGLVDLIVGDPGALGGFGRALVFMGVQPLTAGPAGAIDDASLRLGRDDNGRVVLSWSASCASGQSEDYAVYRGTLGDFQSHAPVTCSSGGMTTWAVSSGDGNRYYLVVPRTLDSEGSYGRDGFADERLPSSSACFAQAIAVCE